MYKIDYKIVRTDGRERLDNELIALLKDNYGIVRATTCSMGVEYLLMKKTVDTEQVSKELDKAFGELLKAFGGSEDNDNPTTNETIIRDIEGDD